MNLKGYYNELKGTPPPSEKQKFREEVQKECRISEETFHRWKRNPEQIPHLAVEKIESIIKKWNKDA